MIREALLQNSPFENSINALTKSFDIDIKPAFRDLKEAKYIRFGSGHDHNPWLNVYRGHLKLLRQNIFAIHPMKNIVHVFPLDTKLKLYLSHPSHA